MVKLVAADGTEHELPDALLLKDALNSSDILAVPAATGDSLSAMVDFVQAGEGGKAVLAALVQHQLPEPSRYDRVVDVCILAHYMRFERLQLACADVLLDCAIGAKQPEQMRVALGVAAPVETVAEQDARRLYGWALE
jgi:hypothetical protein